MERERPCVCNHYFHFLRKQLRAGSRNRSGYKAGYWNVLHVDAPSLCIVCWGCRA